MRNCRLSLAYKLEPENPVVLIHLANHFFFKGVGLKSKLKHFIFCIPHLHSDSAQNNIIIVQEVERVWNTKGREKYEE